MHILRELALEQQQRLMDALVMTAGREKGAGVGGYVYNLSASIGALNKWIRGFDADNLDFNTWAQVSTEAGRVFDEWYDWFQREYSTPHEPLFGFSIDEFCTIGGLTAIEEILANSEQTGGQAA